MHLPTTASIPLPPLKVCHYGKFVGCIPEWRRKNILQLKSPTQLSYQKLVCLPFPIRILVLRMNSSHPFLISFHRFSLKESLTSLVVQPPSTSPNFPLMTFPRKLSFSRENCHNHLPNQAWLSSSKCLNPNLPCFLSFQITNQLTKCIFLLSSISSHKNFLWILSNLILTFLGIAKSDIK